MQNNSLYSEFASRFAEASTDSLIKSFNNQVGNRGFNSARAAYDKALFGQIKRRGIDVSAISTDNSVSFAKKVRIQDNALVIVDLPLQYKEIRCYRLLLVSLDFLLILK